MSQFYDQDIVEAVKLLTSLNVVKNAMAFVKEALPQSLEV